MIDFNNLEYLLSWQEEMRTELKGLQDARNQIRSALKDIDARMSEVETVLLPLSDFIKQINTKGATP